MGKHKYIEMAVKRLNEIREEHPDFKFGEFDVFQGGVRIGYAVVHEGRLQYVIVENPMMGFRQKIKITESHHADRNTKCVA